jgi:NADPH2:quinone reductase
MTNRAVVMEKLGGPEVLRVREVPVANPGPGEVRVRVRAAGIGFAQVMMRHGTYPYQPPLPFVPGADARSYALLHAGGRLVVYGFAGGDTPEAIAALRSRCRPGTRCRAGRERPSIASARAIAASPR